MARIEIFYSYSHKDEALRDELEKHLSILQRNGVIAGWHDRRIGAGDDWKDQIDDHLNSAGVILLLISPDFIASDYCYDVEMQRAMARHDAGEACVIPVVLRPCDWKGAPFAKLQMLPTDAKPVTSWSNRDEAFYNVEQGIRKAIEAIPGDPAPRLSPLASSSSPLASRPSPLPPIWNIPHRRNPNFTGREEYLKNLHDALTSGTPAALTQTLSGLGGVGKTQLAVEYAYRHARDYDVVWWVRSEETATLASDYAALALALNLPEREEKDQRVIAQAVREWLRLNGRWLLILDNVKAPEEVYDYLPAGGEGH